MNNHESAVSGVILGDAMYAELREVIVDTLADRLRFYHSDELLNAIFSNDEGNWALIEEDLTDTAMDVLKGFTGHDRVDFSGAA